MEWVYCVLRITQVFLRNIYCFRKTQRRKEIEGRSQPDGASCEQRPYVSLRLGFFAGDNFGFRVFPTIFAGTPATIAKSGTSFVTTAPAPTNAFAPIVMPHMSVALLPMLARVLTRVGITFQSEADCSEPSALTARGYGSLINITPWPTNTPSSMVTPSQIKVW